MSGGWDVTVFVFVFVLKKLYISVCALQGGEILVSSRLGPRMKSVVNMNERAHDNMSASHGRCENGKENENASGKGVVYQNNILNIKLMYSCFLCAFLQQTVRLS